MSAKSIIQNLQDSQLIRIFLDFVQTYHLQYEKIDKEISYKCHEATWILASTKATGYGRTQSEAYKHALRNLLQILIEDPPYTQFFVNCFSSLMGDCSSSAVNGTGYSFNNGSANMNNNGYTHHTNNMNTNISNYSTFNQNSQSPITANPNSRNPTQPQQPTQSQTKHKVLTNKPPLYSNLSASFTSSSSNAAVMGGQGKTPGNSVNGSTNKKQFKTEGIQSDQQYCQNSMNNLAINSSINNNPTNPTNNKQPTRNIYPNSSNPNTHTNNPTPTNNNSAYTSQKPNNNNQPMLSSHGFNYQYGYGQSMTKINGASHNQASSSISNNKKDKNIEKEKIGYKDSYGYGDSEYGHQMGHSKEELGYTVVQSNLGMALGKGLGSGFQLGLPQGSALGTTKVTGTSGGIDLGSGMGIQSKTAPNYYNHSNNTSNHQSITTSSNNHHNNHNNHNNMSSSYQQQLRQALIRNKQLQQQLLAVNQQNQILRNKIKDSWDNPNPNSNPITKNNNTTTPTSTISTNPTNPNQKTSNTVPSTQYTITNPNNVASSILASINTNTILSHNHNISSKAMRVNSTINNYNGSGNINGNGNSNINSNINSNVNTNNPNTTITNNPTKPPSTTTIMKDITNHPHPQSHILKKDKEQPGIHPQIQGSQKDQYPHAKIMHAGGGATALTASVKNNMGHIGGYLLEDSKNRNSFNNNNNNNTSTIANNNTTNINITSNNNPTSNLNNHNKSKVLVPKLKLQILPNYHKKAEKSLNDSLLAIYQQKHGQYPNAPDYEQPEGVPANIANLCYNTNGNNNGNGSYHNLKKII